jgi:hypothetical protein
MEEEDDISDEESNLSTNETLLGNGKEMIIKDFKT